MFDIASDVAKGLGDVAGDVRTSSWMSPATSPPQDHNRRAMSLDVASDVASSPGDVAWQSNP
jgi:hypothetical protein